MKVCIYLCFAMHGFELQLLVKNARFPSLSLSSLHNEANYFGKKRSKQQQWRRVCILQRSNRRYIWDMLIIWLMVCLKKEKKRRLLLSQLSQVITKEKNKIIVALGYSSALISQFCLIINCSFNFILDPQDRNQSLLDQWFSRFNEQFSVQKTRISLFNSSLLWWIKRRVWDYRYCHDRSHLQCGIYLFRIVDYDFD